MFLARCTFKQLNDKMSEKALPPSSSNCACPRDPYCLGMCEYTGCITDPTPLDFTLPLPPDSSSPDPPLNSATDSSHSPISADPPLNCTDPPLISADPPSTSTASASRGYDRPSQTKRFKQATVEELSQLSKGLHHKIQIGAPDGHSLTSKTGPMRGKSILRAFFCLLTLMC